MARRDRCGMTRVRTGQARIRSSLAPTVIGVLVSGVFLWLAVRRADPGLVWQTLTSANRAQAILASGLLMLVYPLQSLRWRELARGKKRVRSYLGLVVAGVAANNVAPGRLGDWLRVTWLARLERMGWGRALSTVVFDRCSDVVVLVALVAVALPFSDRPTWLLRVGIGGAVLVAVVLAVVVSARTIAHVVRLGDRGSRLARLVRDLFDGLARRPDVRSTVVALLLSASAWLVWASGAWLAARSVGIGLSFAQTLLLTGIVNLGVAIPSSPGFVGTYQWLVISTLAVGGIEHDRALAYAILLHAAWYLPTTFAGGVMLALRLLKWRTDGSAASLRGLRARAATVLEPAAHERAEYP